MPNQCRPRISTIPLFANLIWPCTIFLIASLALSPGLGDLWLLDDRPALVDNEYIHLTTLTFAALRDAALSFAPNIGSRPLAMLSFALDHYFSGLDAVAFKRTNIVLHSATALALFYLARLLLTAFTLLTPPARLWGAAALATVWGLHPLHVSTVLYTVQRMEIGVTLFTVLALIAYLQGRLQQWRGERAWPWFIVAVVAFVLALGWKENAAALLFYILALELTCLRFQANDPVLTRLWLWLYLIGSLAALLVFLLVVVPHYARFDTPYTGRDFNTLERLLTQLRVLSLYLQQILLPIPSTLRFYYDGLIPSRGWLTPPTTLFSGLLLVALLIWAWRWRHRAPLFSLGVFWFFGAHAITSNVIGLELAFEHRNYFAVFAVWLAVLGLLLPLWQRGLLPNRIVPVALGVGLISLASLTALRAATWRDPLIFALTYAEYAPSSPRALTNLGDTAYEKLKETPDQRIFELGVKGFTQAGALPRSKAISDVNLILLYALARQSVPDWVWQRLQNRLRQADLALLRHNEMEDAVLSLPINYNHGFRTIDPQQLLDTLNIFLQRLPDQPPYRYIQIGNFVLNAWHDPEKAKPYYLQAVKRTTANDPRVPNLLSALQKMGYADLARYLEQQRHSS